MKEILELLLILALYFAGVLLFAFAIISHDTYLLVMALFLVYQSNRLEDRFNRGC